MDLGNVASLSYFAPELLLSTAVLAIVLLDLVLERKTILGPIALIAGVGALALLAQSAEWNQGWLFNRMLVFDSFSVFFRALIGLATVVAVWMSVGSHEV